MVHPVVMALGSGSRLGLGSGSDRFLRLWSVLFKLAECGQARLLQIFQTPASLASLSRSCYRFLSAATPLVDSVRLEFAERWEKVGWLHLIGR